MNSLTKFSHRKLYRELMIRWQPTVAMSSSSTDIFIPNRIERGPTDILKALESTISKNYKTPHYKFQDDPYLTPLSKFQNRSYALAREAGKKAAIWVRQEHSDLFQHKVADPQIKAFIPTPVYTDESKVTEETLLYEISNGNFDDSIKIYDLLKGEMSVPTKQAFFELLCFYNNYKPTDTYLLESHWYAYNMKRNVNTWINRPHIDVLFEFLKKQEPVVTAAAYNALICGLVKHFHVDKAWRLYTECQENDIALSVNAYNAILLLAPQSSEGDDKIRTFIYDVLKAMAANGVTPNIHTFNATLNTIANLKSNQTVIEFARGILAEITRFNLKPSLTTYHYILRILSRFGDDARTNFVKILTSLKNDTLTMQDVKDTNFFITAMEMASRHFCDRQLGEMVNDLLLTGENYKFIGDAFRENIYYRSYLELILASESFETFFTVYDKLVPHVTIPEPATMKIILETLQLYPAETITQYIEKLWSHVVMFGHLDRENLIENILHLISVSCKPKPDSPLNAKFAEIALAVWDHTQAKSVKRIQNVTISNITVSNIVILLLRGDNFEKAIEVMSYFSKSPHLIIGTITKEGIDGIFELSLAQAHLPMLLTLLDYVISAGLDGAEEMARKMYKDLSFTPAQEEMLIALVGKNVLEPQPSEECQP